MLRALLCLAGVALLACGSDTPRAATRPDLSQLMFEGGTGQPAPLSAYGQTAGAEPQLLVLRVMASWCGPCRWQAEHTRSLLPAAQAGRVRVLDVLIAGQDNGAPLFEDVRDWQARVQGSAEVLVDPDQQLARYFPRRSGLPALALVEAQSLRLISALARPTPDGLSAALTRALAELDGDAAPVPHSPELQDGRFTRDSWDMIRAMQLGEPNPDPSNAYAELPLAAAWGKTLFFDGLLTPHPRQVACGSCHAPDLLFQDAKDQPPEGVGSGQRNVPSVILATDQRWQFWDGRADSAWAQALAPFEDPAEMASSRLYVAHQVAARHRDSYTQIFGALPDLSDTARFPPEGRPGDASWQGMTEADRTQVDRVFANVGKALAAYERSLRPAPNALDRYAAGDASALTTAEKDGLLAFFSAGCAQCHHGPRLSDDSFHVLRFPTGRPDRSADPGRIDGIELLRNSEFSRASDFADGPRQPRTLAEHPRLLGAFKTPGLRGVAFTVPYGHGGSYGGLVSTLEAHRSAGLPAGSALALGDSDAYLIDFDAARVPEIISFLKALRLDVSQ